MSTTGIIIGILVAASTSCICGNVSGTSYILRDSLPGGVTEACRGENMGLFK